MAFLQELKCEPREFPVFELECAGYLAMWKVVCSFQALLLAMLESLIVTKSSARSDRRNPIWHLLCTRLLRNQCAWSLFSRSQHGGYLENIRHCTRTSRD